VIDCSTPPALLVPCVDSSFVPVMLVVCVM
jgi:hypothetical protein